MADHRSLVERDECLIRTVAALDFGQLAYAPDKFVSTSRRVSALPGLGTYKSRWKDVLTSAKQRPEQPNFIGWCLRNRPLDGKRHTYADIWFCVKRRQLGSKRSESIPRLGLMGRECGEHRLFLCDGIAQGIAVQTRSGWSACVCSRVIKIVLHELAAGRKRPFLSNGVLVGNFPLF